MKRKNMEEEKVVIYESRTGNTEKIAKEIADVLQCRTMKVNEVLSDEAKDYQLIIFGTPVHYACPLRGIERMLEELKVKGFHGFYAIFCTYGAPWREFSAKDCLTLMKKFGEQKCLGEFYCPGIHEMFGTFEGRPNQEDFDHARIFAQNVIDAFLKVSNS
jgi:flavodoxin